MKWIKRLLGVAWSGLNRIGSGGTWVFDEEALDYFLISEIMNDDDLTDEQKKHKVEEVIVASTEELKQLAVAYEHCSGYREEWRP